MQVRDHDPGGGKAKACSPPCCACAPQARLGTRGNGMMRPRGWGKATAWWICGARVQGCGHRVSVLERWATRKGYALASMQPGEGQAKVHSVVWQHRHGRGASRSRWPHRARAFRVC